MASTGTDTGATMHTDVENAAGRHPSLVPDEEQLTGEADAELLGKWHSLNSEVEY